MYPSISKMVLGIQEQRTWEPPGPFAWETSRTRDPLKTIFAVEKAPIKHSTSHTEIHNPTIASMYFESASTSEDASGC